MRICLSLLIAANCAASLSVAVAPAATARTIAEVEHSAMNTPQKPKTDSPAPDPKLTPEAVVRLQVEAMRRNDVPTPDSGIRTAFRFASPANREVTGPVEQFILLVKNPLYRPLLDHKSARYETLPRLGDAARVRATLVAADGNEVAFVFTLTKQTVGEYANCWMTDGVERVDDEERKKELRGIARNNGHAAH